MGENNWFANRFEEHRALFEGRGLSDARLLDRRFVLINGTAGAVITVRGRTISLMGVHRSQPQDHQDHQDHRSGARREVRGGVLGLNEARRLRAPN